MEIKESIDVVEGMPVLAFPSYLNSLNGVERIGYFVEGKACLPFVVRKKHFLKWVELYCPVVGIDTPQEEKIFLNESIKVAKESLDVSHIISTNTVVFSYYPDDAEYCKWGSYIVDLTQDEEVLFKSLHSKHRNVIRKAESNGLITCSGKEFALDVIALMNETSARQGSKYAFDNSFVDKLNQLGDNVDWWIVKDSEGNIHGSAIFLWSKGSSCYYLHGGSSSHTSSGAMNYLIWKAMLSMKARGVIDFDFVGARLTTVPGSKLEGIQRFKSRFGSVMKVGYMFRVICNPPKYALHRFVLFVFKKLNHIKSKDTITEERLKGNY